MRSLRETHGADLEPKLFSFVPDVIDSDVLERESVGFWRVHFHDRLAPRAVLDLESKFNEFMKIKIDL